MSDVNPNYERFKRIAYTNPKDLVGRDLKALLVHRQIIARSLQGALPPNQIELLWKLIEYDDAQIKLLLNL